MVLFRPELDCNWNQEITPSSVREVCKHELYIKTDIESFHKFNLNVCAYLRRVIVRTPSRVYTLMEAGSRESRPRGLRNRLQRVRISEHRYDTGLIFTDLPPLVPQLRARIP